LDTIYTKYTPPFSLNEKLKNNKERRKPIMALEKERGYLNNNNN
jgi:hypothetical protein